ncbi:protein transport protein Sec31A isoform X9 [Coregonus clupeaformis]|uniref:protein transport protein Sec31A isoform X9 n=1 Tax=Coregonus clupeaformis TaxID=59861 RepID=UPI001E1C66D2|nr:protein transport protein Sec31A isoform X9 [Coregonus clupeaformis]
MKLKEINRTAIQSWSPAQHHPVYLAAGTSAQQLDASFSTTASLEIFELDLADPSLDMKLRGAYSSSHRYHKLAWGPHGMDAQGLPSGVLIAGGENGDVILYDPAKIIAGHSDVVIAQSDKHSGPVRALDVNSFQTNLVASGGNESEIYIWDLNNFGSPMTPGPKTQPLEDISCVAWNRQVQHILASASPSGRASIWDLRKNDLIIKVSDHSNRMHCSGLEWNPEVATQLVLASEDDRMPVIQIWDLRFATSPLKVLENHTRGVLAIAWSLADPELLLSCGKDNRILCWNPNTAEVLYELPTSTQWCFDIQWCPRNPAVLSAAAFDGHISIYSIMGGSSQAFSQTQADTISTSFGNMDPFGMGQTLPPLQLPKAPAAHTTITPLKKPPKWIRRPVGASFAFGGKLVSLENIKPNPQQPQQPTAHVVHISQVITETTFLERSAQLQDTLAAGSFIDFCQEKIDSAQNEFEKTVWSFLKVNFENDTRGKYLELLGYKKEELAAKIAAALEGEPIQPEEEVAPPVEEEDSLPEEAPAPVPEGVKLCVSQGVDGLITQALLTGDFEGAVELCLHDNRMADSIILAIAGGAELLEKTQRKYFTKTHSKITKLISAVVMRDWRDVLQTCELQNWKEALAAVMTYAQPEEFSSLCDLLGCRLEAVEDSTLQAQACLCYICAGNVEKLVSCWTRAQDRHCPLSLQDLVEKVVVLRRAVEQTQESGPSAVGLLLGEKMSQYASLLASQGSLTTAIAYLPQNTEQVAVLQLRDRLSRALGQQAPAAGPALTPVAQVQPQLPSPQPRQLFAPAQPSMVSQQPAPAPVPAAAPAPQQYYQPVRSASTVTSWSNQTPTALPSVPPPPPHLGPATTEPQAQPTPAMYGMPPTGSAAPPDSSAAAYPPMYSHQYQPYPPASQYNPGTGGPAIYSPLQYSTPPPPSFSSSSPQAPAPGFMPQYTQQPLYPPPSMGQPVSSAPPSHPPFSPPPLSSGASFQHGGPGSPASYMPPLPPTGSSGTQPDPASQRTEGYSPDTTCFMEGEGPQNGWNDPPTLSRVPKKKKVPENYTPPSPITAPIFSPLGAGDPQQPPSMPPGQAQNQAPYQGMQQQQQMAPPPMNPGMLKTRGGSVEGAPGAPIGDVIHPLQSIPAEKITKKPIPEEHLILKSTFEGLIQKCLAAATDPQTKRKLDDANKRLEALYDKLREQTLSPAIVGGLHNMVQCIESRSYMESLNIHTHIVSSSNFSETSAFMPVLKVVLTQANKLGV